MNTSNIIDILLKNIMYYRNNFPLECIEFYTVYTVEIVHHNVYSIYRTLTIKRLKETILNVSEANNCHSILMWNRNFWNDIDSDKLLFVLRSGEDITDGGKDHHLTILTKILGIELYQSGRAFKIHNLTNDSTFINF